MPLNTCKISDFRVGKNTILEEENLRGINTNNIKTNIINTDSINLNSNDAFNLKEIKDTYPANRVQIETNENIEKDIKKLGLEIENVKNYSYTIKISDEQKAHELLKELVLKGITIDKFEIMKPKLNDIFIEKVGE